MASIHKKSSAFVSTLQYSTRTNQINSTCSSSILSVTEKFFSNIKLLLLVSSTFFSSSTLAEADTEECQKYVSSNPVKRFFQKAFDSNNVMDSSCYETLERNKLLKISDDDYVATETADAEFRAKTKQSTNHDAVTAGPNLSRDLTYTEAGQQTNEDDETPSIQTVDGYTTPK